MMLLKLSSRKMHGVVIKPFNVLTATSLSDDLILAL